MLDHPSRTNVPLDVTDRPSLDALATRNPSPLVGRIIGVVGIAITGIAILMLALFFFRALSEGVFSNTQAMIGAISFIFGIIGVAVLGLLLMATAWALRALNAMVIASEYQALASAADAPVEAVDLGEANASERDRGKTADSEGR